MKQSHLFIRILFLILCPLCLTIYTSMQLPGEMNFGSLTIGIIGGLCMALILIGLEICLRRVNLQNLNLSCLGIFCGYLLGSAILLPLNSAISLLTLNNPAAWSSLAQIIVYLITCYFGVILALRANEDFQFVLPFIKLESGGKQKKDIVVDSSTLLDTRIIDLASTGLLDNHLIIPRFVLKELNYMNEHGEDSAKLRARRCIEVIRKLEGIPGLNLRYIDTDFPELKDSATKLSHLARTMDASIMTADPSRPPQAAEGVRTMHINTLTSAFKTAPRSGEFLTIKIQRKGKEPGQGVGYLEDGTMVVVNGGEEYLFGTIKAQILSVKTTSSGQMVFCNAAEDDEEEEEISTGKDLTDTVNQLETKNKNYFAAVQE
ncbi:MAG: hypothetical protein H0W50_03455 [Parachlamydiaceae bacterium]|nr:hypothetical protein [Parachlamydiaceae bacterium]